LKIVLNIVKFVYLVLFLFKRYFSTFSIVFLLSKFQTFFSPKYADRRQTTQPPFQSTPGCISLMPSGQCAVDHLLLFSVEITNKWSCFHILHTASSRAKGQLHLHVYKRHSSRNVCRSSFRHSVRI